MVASMRLRLSRRWANHDIALEVVDGGLRVRAFALSADGSRDTAFVMVTDPRLQQLISEATSLD